jgi:hypothetical protein
MRREGGREAGGSERSRWMEEIPIFVNTQSEKGEEKKQGRKQAWIPGTTF